jgi:hypothetical protein
MSEKGNTRREKGGYNEENIDPRLVDTDFIQNQGLSSKATDFGAKRKRADDAQYREEEALNEARYEMERVAAEEAEMAARQTVLRRRRIAQKQQSLSSATAKLRGVSSIARWTGIGIAGTAYIWQFLFGMISLIGFGAKGYLDSLIKETVIGKIVAKVVGLFVDIEKLFPVEYLGLGFWGLATIIGLCTFLAFAIWFTLTGVRIFRSTMSTFITAVVFACCILPVANLFPAVLVWIIYTNMSATYDLFSSKNKS